MYRKTKFIIYIFILINISVFTAYSQDNSLIFSNKTLEFGSDIETVSGLFKGFEKVTRSEEPAAVSVYSKTFIQIDKSKNEIPFDAVFYFYNKKLFGAEFIEYYTAEGPDPNYNTYERFHGSIDDIKGQLTFVSQKDSMGLTYTFMVKNGIKAVFYSEDYADLTCFDTYYLNEIRKSNPGYRPEF